MNDAVPHCCYRREHWLRLKPVQQKALYSPALGRRKFVNGLPRDSSITDDEIAAGRPDTLDLTVQLRERIYWNAIRRETDA